MNSKTHRLSRTLSFGLAGCCFGGCAVGASGQGQIFFSNHATGIVITHVYAPDPSSPTRYQYGNGPNDYQPGTQDWTGFTPLLGTGYTAQLWGVNGADQPESSLQPIMPTTTFYTVPAGAGWVVPVGYVSVPGAPENAIATLTLRVWDNQGGTITSWAMARAAGVASGESPLFNSQPLSLDLPGPWPVGLVSFNIHEVPEPSALALVGLGALLLPVFCLRKRPRRL